MRSELPEVNYQKHRDVELEPVVPVQSGDLGHISQDAAVNPLVLQRVANALGVGPQGDIEPDLAQRRTDAEEMAHAQLELHEPLRAVGKGQSVGDVKGSVGRRTLAIDRAGKEVHADPQPGLPGAALPQIAKA